MKICPKCNREVEYTVAICPHCGLVFAKWEASQQSLKELARRTVEVPDEPQAVKVAGEVGARDDLGYRLGWVGGLFAPLGLCIATFNYAIGYRRRAFQALSATWWSAPLLFLGGNGGSVTALVLLAVSPPVTLYLVRKLDWPRNKARPALVGRLGGLYATPGATEPDSGKSYVKNRSVFLGFIAALLGAMGLIGYRYPSDASVLFMMPAAIGFFYVLGAAVRFSFPCSFANRMDRLVRIVAVVLIIVIFGFTLIRAEQIAKASMQTVIEALERYRDVYGRYPDSLKDLIPQHLAVVPECHSGIGWMHYFPNQVGKYGDKNKDVSFHLSCHYFMFTKLAYDSDTHKWYSYD
jgi:hypothetical protein